MKNKILSLSRHNTQLHVNLEKLLIKRRDIHYQICKIRNAKAFRLWREFKKGQRTSPTLKYTTKIVNRFLRLMSVKPIGLSPINGQYSLWFDGHYPTVTLQITQKLQAKKLTQRPLISLITPTFNTPEKFLRDCIESVLHQTYANWELCIADDHSTKSRVRKVIREYAAKDKRIKYIFRKANGHICESSNSAISISSGKYLAILDHDDILWPNALYEMVSAINQHPQAQLIYSDEDKLEEDEATHVDPFFKPDWSPDYLKSINYITHFCLLDRSLVDQVGHFRKGYEGAQDWDLFLRATYQIQSDGNERDKIIHVPKILYSWRKSESSTASERYVGKVKQYAYVNQVKTLQDDIVRQGFSGKVLKTKYFGLYHTKYNIIGNPRVSIIIPTKNKYRFISDCVNSIIKKTTYSNYEIVIIDNGSTDSEVRVFYQKITTKNNNVQIHQWNNEFNFASICNFGASVSQGEYLLFLNNDTQVISPDWIQELLQHAQKKYAGAVGAKLLYANNKIQHAGVIVGLTGFAGHIFQNTKNCDSPHFPFGKIHWTRNYLAVTAACVMVKKDIYLLVKGMNPKFKVGGNDVDLCLRLYQKGYYNIYSSTCELYHFESQTRDPLSTPIGDFHESLKSYRNYLIKGDPFYNPNLSYWHTVPHILTGNEENPYDFSVNHVRRLEASPSIGEWFQSTSKHDHIDLSPQQKESLLVSQWYDATAIELKNNRVIVDNHGKISSIKSANWFIPEFTAIYAGINNIFRFVEFLEKQGIRNTIIVDTPNDISSIKKLVYASYPALTNSRIIQSIQKDQIHHSDISFSTLWTTAYLLLKFNDTKRKIYFIQDYETMFYPAGSEQAIVENTYDFGYLGITNIKILEHIYHHRYHGNAITLKSDIDLSRFFNQKTPISSHPYNVFFYGRPNHPRNGFELGIQSLKILKEKLKDNVNIYSAGADWDPSQFGVAGIINNLGLISLDKLPRFYQDMDVGLFLMFSSHPGVIPFELMASRCPVVINSNNSPGWYDIYADQQNCLIARPSPSIIASKLTTALTDQKLRQVIIEGGQNTVRNLFSNYETEAQKTLDFIKNPRPPKSSVSNHQYHL